MKNGNPYCIFVHCVAYRLAVATSLACTGIRNMATILEILVVVVNHCFTSLFGTKGLLSDIVIR